MRVVSIFCGFNCKSFSGLWFEKEYGIQVNYEVSSDSEKG
jgi:hypothetical protein